MAATQLPFYSATDQKRGTKGVFPNPQHTPARLAQQAAFGAVSGRVSGNLCLPISAVVMRHPAVPAAAVPEAAVHKEGEAVFGKDEVRLPWHWTVPAPACDSVGAKD